jgi:pimeloyl-ACP methyl ester carboxylesterase
LKTLVLLHGAFGSSAQLTSLKQALEKEGFAVYMLNFTGHGGKPFRGHFDIQTFSDDILNFIYENGLGKVSIFGYSMGGYVALWLAHQHPELVEKIVTLGTKFDWSPESASHEVRKMDPEKILEKVPAFARILASRHSPNDWKELMRKTAAMMMQLGDLSVTHRVGTKKDPPANTRLTW